MCCERSSAFLRRSFEAFSRGNAMTCTSRSDTSSSCSPTPMYSVYSAGGGLGRARTASWRGLLFSFFDPTPKLTLFLQYSCKPRYHRREHREGRM